jgi:glycosyltransferase involved in cell wall biosynthesis
MKLSVVIPALNEEESIASIIERTLNAENYLKQNSPVTSLEIIVVSDGSTDKTVEIAKTYLPKIKLIVFEKNKGYGAAIKQGWSEATGELLAFIDADGTCDPLFFSNLCNLLNDKNADVVLGCRLNKESKMPFIRRLGNFIFAKLLTFLSSNYVKDTASGMRVVRKSSLKKIYPLPDGLHFTPAMSARALLNAEIIIAEENMPYHEREGESKLSVTKDGIRFLKVILNTAFLYRPQILINVVSLFSFLIAFALMYNPIIHYINFRNVSNWMIYRFIVSEVFALIGVVLFSSSYILHNTVWLSLSENIESNKTKGLSVKFFDSKVSTLLAIIFMFLGVYIISDSLLTRFETGKTNEHWSRYIIFSYLEVTALILFVTKWCKWILELLKDRIVFIQSEEYKKL